MAMIKAKPTPQGLITSHLLCHVPAFSAGMWSALGLDFLTKYNNYEIPVFRSRPLFNQ